MKIPVFVTSFWSLTLVVSALAEIDTLTKVDTLPENDTVLLNAEDTNQSSDSAEIVSDCIAPEKKLHSESDSGDTITKIDTIDGTLLTKKIKSFQTALSRNISKARIQGYGGGIIIQPMLLGFRTKPVHELVKNDPKLRTFTFDDLNYNSYQPVLVNGAWVYGGVGNGIRIGFGGWGGELYFSSKEKANDSIMVLKVHNSFGGIMIEKVFLHKNLNIIAGGMIGSGSIKVTQSYQCNDVFNNAIWEEDLEGESEAKARQIGIELHTGMTVSVLPWWHIGADVNSHFMASINGFGGSVNSFFSACPGFRLRVVFGNLG